MKVKVICTIIAICFVVQSSYAFGPIGHSWVGAVAELVLAKKDPTSAKKVGDLLHGMSLSAAANLPDKIKEWDKKPPTDPNSFHLAKKYADIEAQLVAFWKANPLQNDETKPNHHWFHYTDISIFQTKYAENEKGSSRWDIVHLIPYCARVLQGKESENNERKITKPVALILLTHYLGDIHQPLHVGADYFDAAGNQVNPDQKPGFDDEGGNGLTLEIQVVDERGHNSTEQFKLHGFWDGEAVESASELVAAETLNNPAYKDLKPSDAATKYFADKEPVNWNITSQTPVDNWAIAWANEILPIAAQAHQRLAFSNVNIVTSHGKQTAVGLAGEKQMPDGITYRNWAGNVIKNEIQRGGWRLAALLSQSVK